MNSVVVQKVQRIYDDPVELAIRYYSLIFAINKIAITSREIQLLAFTAVRGTISSVQSKNAFVKRFGSSITTINNMVSKLTKKGLLYKENGKIKVNKMIALDFNQELLIQIRLKTKEEKKDEQATT